MQASGDGDETIGRSSLLIQFRYRGKSGLWIRRSHKRERNQFEIKEGVGVARQCRSTRAIFDLVNGERGCCCSCTKEKAGLERFLARPLKK